MDLRAELLKKLGRPPYRYSSKQLFEAMPADVFAEWKGDQMLWLKFEQELERMIVEGLVYPQNGVFVRADRMQRKPPERQKMPKKSDPRQKGFGF